MWEMLYADDLVLNGESRQGVGEILVRWKEAMDIRGLIE